MGRTGTDFFSETVTTSFNVQPLANTRLDKSKDMHGSYYELSVEQYYHGHNRYKYEIYFGCFPIAVGRSTVPERLKSSNSNCYCVQTNPCNKIVNKPKWRELTFFLIEWIDHLGGWTPHSMMILLKKDRNWLSNDLLRHFCRFFFAKKLIRYSKSAYQIAR